MNAIGLIQTLWYAELDTPSSEVREAHVRNVETHDKPGYWLHHVIITDAIDRGRGLSARFPSSQPWAELKRAQFIDEHAVEFRAADDASNLTLQGIALTGPLGSRAYAFYSRREDFEKQVAFGQELQKKRR